jgi:hypothetical protein
LKFHLIPVKWLSSRNNGRVTTFLRHGALSSNPSTTRSRERRKRRGMERGRKRRRRQATINAGLDTGGKKRNTYLLLVRM